jgi:uncharacterized protein YndB with AHSA1/START domain
MTGNVAAETSGLVVRLRRILPASREQVYDALTNPHKLARWWGPQGFSCPNIEFEPQVGGSYRIAMQPPQRESFCLSGEFREVKAPVRLAYTFIWSPPAPDDQETLAELSLADKRGGTELTLVQGPFVTEERRALHESGWSEGFDRLREVLD